MCSVRILEQTATFALYCINWLVFITEVDSVYCAVRIESLYNTDTIRFYKVNPLNTKRRLLYLKTKFVPRSKHFSSRL